MVIVKLRIHYSNYQASSLAYCFPIAYSFSDLSLGNILPIREIRRRRPIAVIARGVDPNKCT